MPTAKKTKTKTLTLKVDEQDYKHIIGAIRRREMLGTAGLVTRTKGGAPVVIPLLPDGEGNREGRIVAEICRGWAEQITGWDWVGGEPMNPEDIAEQRKIAP